MLQRVSDHKGSIIRELYTVLGRNYSNGFFVSVDMDAVGVTAAYLPVARVCVYCTVHTRATGKYLIAIHARYKHEDYIKQ